MKINVVNKYEKTEGYIDKSVPIRIVSIGNYELSGNVTMPVTRPKGRLDYQFIYILLLEKPIFISKRTKKQLQEPDH